MKSEVRVIDVITGVKKSDTWVTSFRWVHLRPETSEKIKALKQVQSWTSTGGTKTDPL